MTETIQSKEQKQKVRDLSRMWNINIGHYGFENIYNSDQSGFQLKLHAGRSLAIEGTKR